MSENISETLPRYLRVAHWLYHQQRAVSSREAADEFGISSWSIEREFSRIRDVPEIIVFDEQRIASRGGQQYLLRVIHINPYWLDEYQRPHRKDVEACAIRAPLTWRDLLSNPWYQLVQRYQSCGED